MVNDYTYLKEVVEDLAPVLGGNLDVDGNIVHGISELAMDEIVLTSDSDYVHTNNYNRWSQFKRDGLVTNVWDWIGRIRDGMVVFCFLTCKENTSGIATSNHASWINTSVAYGVDPTFMNQAVRVPTAAWPGGTTSWQIANNGGYASLRVNHTEYYAPSTTVDVRGLIYVVQQP